MAASNIAPNYPKTVDILQCPLCLHQLESPVTLQQCLHTYCKECLDEQLQTTEDNVPGWACYMCGRFTCTEEVKQNDFIQKVLTSQTAKYEINEAVSCKQCLRTSEVKWKCSECRIELCSSCKMGHLNIPLLRGHTVVPIDTEDKRYIDEVVFCDIHTENVIELNCRDCEIPLCVVCKIEHHDVHTSETVHKSVSRLVQKLEECKIRITDELDKLETHINIVRSGMERTKKCFAYDRDQLCHRFEDIVAKLQMIKEEQEDSLNIREAKELQVLEQIKLDLQGNVEQLKQLQSMGSLITIAARNSSLLCQLQSGLLEKMKNIGFDGNKSMTLKVSLPTRVLSESCEKQDTILEDLLGKVNISECEMIDSHATLGDGKNIEENSSICCKQVFHKILEIAPRGYCNTIAHINGHIWVPLDNSIHIYDLSCTLCEVLDFDFPPLAVKNLPGGHIVVGSDKGIFVLKAGFYNKPISLADGTFSDVVVYGNVLYALSPHEILIFKPRHPDQEDEVDFEQSPWIKDNTVQLGCSFKANSCNTFCQLNDTFVVSSLEDGCLFVFDTQGSLKSKLMPNKLLSICGVNEQGYILVSDYYNKQCFSYDMETNTARSYLKLELQKSPCYFVTDNTGSLWLLVEEEGKFIVQKYVNVTI